MQHIQNLYDCSSTVHLREIIVMIVSQMTYFSMLVFAFHLKQMKQKVTKCSLRVSSLKECYVIHDF